MERENGATDEATATLVQSRPPSNNLKKPAVEMKIGHILVHFQEGLEVVDVVTPQQFLCKIKPKDENNNNISKEYIGQTLSNFPTESIFHFPRPDKKRPFYCGKVNFKDRDTAMDVIDKINADDEVDFSLVPDDEIRDEFTLKLRWWRCPRKNHCFVTLKNPEDKHKLVGRYKIDCSGYVKVKESYRENSLVIFKLSPYSTEEQIKKGLAKRLGLKEYSERFDVFIPLEKRFISRKTEMETAKINVETQLSNFVEMDKFEANVLPYKEKHVTCTAYVKFVDAKSCQTVAEGLLESGIQVGTTIAKTTVEFAGSVSIPRHSYNLVDEDVVDYVKMVNDRFLPNTLRVCKQDSRNMCVHILAPSLHKLAKLKKDLDEIVKGSVIDLNTEQSSADKLFTDEAKPTLKVIEATTGTNILVNHCARKVTVRGLKTDINLALKLIHKFLKDIEKLSKAVLDLKASTTPPGLLRYLMDKYGLGLSAMISSTGLKLIEVNVREHKVNMVGDMFALLKAEQAIKRIEEKFWSEDRDDKASTESCEALLINEDKTLYGESNGTPPSQNAQTASNVEETTNTENAEAPFIEVGETPISENVDTPFAEVDKTPASENANSSIESLNTASRNVMQSKIRYSSPQPTNYVPTEVEEAIFSENTNTPFSEVDEAQVSEDGVISGSDDPSCPVCLGVVHASKNFRLQNCNHTYCAVCIASWIDFCEKDHAFPLTCMVSGCVKNISNHDMDRMQRKRIIFKKAVLQGAVRSFVRKNSDQYGFCPSPMCGTVYKVGARFRCPACHRRFCTSCHAPLHQGVTCKKYTRAKTK